MQKPKHGITFEVNGIKKHTWIDWQIVPNKCPFFPPPTPRKNLITVPGRDGAIDASRALTGDIVFENRTNTFECIVHHSDNWVNTFTEICDFLHGNKVKIAFDDDPTFYYEGNAIVDWKNGKQTYVSITAEVEPYKKRKTETVVTKTIKGQGKVICPNLRKRVVPLVTSNASMNITLDNKTMKLTSGTVLCDFPLEPGCNEILVKGNGTVTFKYQEEGF